MGKKRCLRIDTMGGRRAGEGQNLPVVRQEGKKPKRVVLRQEKRHPIKAQILIERETKKF
jgi:hypothetical protein